MGSGFWIIITILVIYMIVKLYRGYAEFDISFLKYRQLKNGHHELTRSKEEDMHGNKDEKKVETF